MLNVNVQHENIDIEISQQSDVVTIAEFIGLSKAVIQTCDNPGIALYAIRHMINNDEIMKDKLKRR